MRREHHQPSPEQGKEREPIRLTAVSIESDGRGSFVVNGGGQEYLVRFWCNDQWQQDESIDKKLENYYLLDEDVASFDVQLKREPTAVEIYVGRLLRINREGDRSIPAAPEEPKYERQPEEAKPAERELVTTIVGATVRVHQDRRQSEPLENYYFWAAGPDGHGYHVQWFIDTAGQRVETYNLLRQLQPTQTVKIYVEPDEAPNSRRTYVGQLVAP